MSNETELWESRKNDLDKTSKVTLLDCWRHCSDGWRACAAELEIAQDKAGQLERKSPEANMIIESKASDKMKKLDIPDNLSAELKRLHDMIEDNGGSANKESREWAMDKIDQIHKILFHPTYVIGSTFSGVGQDEE